MGFVLGKRDSEGSKHGEKTSPSWASERNRHLFKVPNCKCTKKAWEWYSCGYFLFIPLNRIILRRILYFSSWHNRVKDWFFVFFSREPKSSMNKANTRMIWMKAGRKIYRYQLKKINLYDFPIFFSFTFYVLSPALPIC